MDWLLDGNLLVALRIDTHLHHQRAHRWFRSRLRDYFVTCPQTQGTLLRVHMTLAADRSALAAWKALSEIVSHPRHRFWPDNFSYLEVSGDRLQGAKQVTDAWLAELARRKGGKVATLDEGLVLLHSKLAELVP
jgi:toxin-antitoxin system PIN domain toxin